MSDILIVGGGFAAVWTAAAAARRRLEAGLAPADLSITVVAPDDHMTIRPRLYEAEPAGMQVALHRVLDPIGVRHLRATVRDVDVARGEIAAVDRDGAHLAEGFERLVIAAGSRLVRPTGTAGSEHFHDIDTMTSAVALDKRLHELPSLPPTTGRFTVVVVGAGFVGLELATELVGRLRAIAEPGGSANDVRVVLVERAELVGPELGPGPRPNLVEALDELGVQRRLGTTVTGFDGAAVQLSDGTQIRAATVVWTAGMRAGEIAERVPGRHDPLGRLEVDRHMRIDGVPSAFAAGDTASIEVAPGHRALQSCQYAHQMGKHAGHNAVADLLGAGLVEFRPDPYVTCVDLGAAGAVYTEGFEQAVVATGDAAKSVKRMVNQELIYPPVDDAAAILRSADHLAESRPPKPADRAQAATGSGL